MEWVTLATIYFDDGSAQSQEMARGSEEHCKSVADLIPGIAYKGDKKFKEARVGLMRAADWDNTAWEAAQ